MPEKITGYFLLTAGLLTLLLSVFNIYQVFTSQVSPISVFQFSGVSLDLSPLLPPGAISSRAELIPASDLNYVSNLTAHYLLVSFFVTVGYKVASLGIQLLRPLQVKVERSLLNQALTRATQSPSASSP